jgi:hypothetical protein
MGTELTYEERVALANLDLTRDQVCRACDQYIFANSPYGERWSDARCRAMGTDENHMPITVINSALRRGPETTCPLGKWVGVAALPDDEVEQKRLTLEADAIRFLKRNEPLIRRLPEKEKDLAAALDEMVNLEDAPDEKSVSLAPLLRDAIIAELEKADTLPG